MAGIEEKDVAENLLPWLALKSATGIGNRLFKRLIDQWIDLDIERSKLNMQIEEPEAVR